MFRAERCPCGQRTCKDWHVYPVAAVQGVGFTEAQARAVVALLNAMDTAGRDVALKGVEEKQ